MHDTFIIRNGKGRPVRRSGFKNYPKETTMKNYIKSFLLFALVCVGLVSCNEQDMPDNVTYPTNGPLATWKSVNTQSGLEFYVINSLSAEGDTICNVIARNPQEDQIALAMNNGRGEYDARTGMFLNNFATSFIQGLPAEIAVALRNDMATASVQLAVFVGKDRITQDYFVATGQKGFPVATTMWNSVDTQAPIQAALLFIDKTTFMAATGETMHAGTYEWDEVNGQGVLHMGAADENGELLPDAQLKDQQLYMNAANQLTMNIDGVEYPLMIVQN